ncbi:MAG: hypothetical protein FWD03_04565 [Defluviitaleaceae bacterium]|nr:hypothetical protein [Defluviitaleaceae bacterium]
MTEKLKTKACEFIAEALIKEAEMSSGTSRLRMASEPTVPVELLMEEDAE